jgi:HEPN domain-containing protein
MAYANLVNARPSDIARFERRGVKVVNLPGTRERYGDVLAAAFAELREYRREHAGPTLKPTEERPLEQFLLPRDGMTRLCLFATLLDVLPFYREYIFPLAEAAGFVPVTGADVVNLRESVSAKIDTLIDRAAVMVVDATSPSTQFELGMAITFVEQSSARPNRQPLRLISVVTERAQLPISGKEFRILTRPDALSEDSEFVRQLGGVFQTLWDEMGLAQNQEPRRLFEAKEYRAAVIAAMTLLEATLRQRLSMQSSESLQRPMSLRQLLDRAARAGVVVESREEIPRWMVLRNDAVHTARPVSKNEAEAVVEGVERILGIRQ